MEFRILGPLEVLMDGRRAALSGDKQRVAPALLVIHANRTVSPERLIDELWGERPPASAAKTLQVHISRLRKGLEQAAGDVGGVVVTRDHGYELRVDRERVDSIRFERLIGQARGELAVGRVARAASLLEEALSLWRGPPLSEFSDERFAEVESARLGELRLAALEELIAAKLALGRHTEVVGELEALIADHPYRERLRAQLMLALYRSDRQAEALQAYQDARCKLVEELGIEPGHELRELHQAVLAQDPRLDLAAAARPLPGPDARPSPPPVANPLLGRPAELRAVRDLLAGDARLVTVTGVGGSGKTRLALELATSLVDESARAVCFVALAPVRDPQLLPAAIISALGIEESPGSAVETIERALAGQPALLVLDNFEHLTPRAPILTELLAACPQLDVLVTSRASLHLSGEHEYPLNPLPLADAVALFKERARAVRPDFAADPFVLRAICARLDCLPLAVELAAARCRLLSCQELLPRLQHRLELLTGGARDLESRQQTLRATIEWSYELLDPEERRLFATVRRLLHRARKTTDR